MTAYLLGGPSTRRWVVVFSGQWARSFNGRRSNPSGGADGGQVVDSFLPSPIRQECDDKATQVPCKPWLLITARSTDHLYHLFYMSLIGLENQRTRPVGDVKVEEPIPGFLTTE
jgi:hypothetical protein